MCNHLIFNHKKSAQCLNFFAIKAGGSVNKLKALKLVYFADRYHLRKYGRPITNDEYWAMPYGPVASGVKDIAEMSDFLGDEEKRYAENYLRVGDHFDIESIRILKTGDLSESDIEALEFSWNQFSHYQDFDLARHTHAYPEWKKHEQQLAAQECTRVRMNYEDFFDDPQERFNKCHFLSAQEKSDQLEYIKERDKLEALWG